MTIKELEKIFILVVKLTALYFYCGESYALKSICQKSYDYTLQKVNFSVCKLYLN